MSICLQKYVLKFKHKSYFFGVDKMVSDKGKGLGVKKYTESSPRVSCVTVAHSCGLFIIYLRSSFVEFTRRNSHWTEYDIVNTHTLADSIQSAAIYIDPLLV